MIKLILGFIGILLVYFILMNTWKEISENKLKLPTLKGFINLFKIK